MKKIFIQIQIILLFISIGNTLLAQASVMDSLKNALYAANPDLNKAERLIKQIRYSRSVGYINSLQEQLVHVREHTVESFELSANPYMPVQYELEATIVSLELDRDKITDIKARGRRLLQQVETKLNNKQVINTEMILLKENATALTDELISKLFDNTPENLKVIVVAVLKKSADPTIENKVLQHIDLIEPDRLVYAHALSLLSNRGGVNTFNYLQKKMKVNKKGQEPLFLLHLNSLSENTPDSLLRTRIREFIKN